MTCFLVSCFFKNTQHPGAYFQFREQRLALLPGSSGRLVTLFQPEGHGDSETPDEIEVLEFPSPDMRSSYLTALDRPALADLKTLAVARLDQFISEAEIPADSMLATIVSKKPELPGLAEQLAARLPKTSATGLHPAQRQADLETTIHQPRNETQRRLSKLVLQWQSERDRRAIFAHTYCLMTGNMLEALEAGEFHDRLWVNRLLDRFAGFYFDALQKYEQTPLMTPQVWRVAFDVSRNPEAFAVQHLLLGVNAHINYDLTTSLVAVLEDEWAWLDKGEKTQRYEDHTHVNEIIETTFDEAQELVIARYAPSLDRLMDFAWAFDDVMVSSLIRSWREQAWQHAVEMLEVRSWDERQPVRQRMEFEALSRADLIMLRQGPMKMPRLF